jgi:hypothetical protein
MIPAILAALGEMGGGAAAGGAAGGGAAGIGGMASSIQGATQKITGSLGQMTAPMHMAEQGLSKFVAGINLFPNKVREAQQMLTGTIDNYLGTLAAPIDTIKHLGDSISKFVKLANPAQVKQFDIAVGDTYATIGNTLTPSLEALTRAARTAGDTYAKLKPALEPVFAETAKLVDMISGEMTPAARELAPYIKLAAGQMTLWTTALKLQIPVWNALLKSADAFGLVKGLTGKSFDELSKSDKEVRSVTTTTSAESVSQKAIEQAMMMALNGPGEAKKDTPDLLKALAVIQQQTLDYLMNQLPTMPTQKDVEKFINELLPKIPGSETARSVGGAVRGAADSGVFGLTGMLASAMTR